MNSKQSFALLFGFVSVYIIKCYYLGGEKKRASIATKLLSNPQILYLDEPTSGLDSTFAFNIMNIMKAYAQQTGKPVVVTIHQPASRIFDAFGNLLVIAMGKMAYFGESHQVVNFFAELDMACAAHFNPGDFILDMVKQDHIQVKRIIEHYENHKNRFWPGEINELEMERNVDEPLHVKKFSIDAQNGPMNSTETIIMTYQDESKKWPTGLWTQLKALTKRSFRQSLYRLTKKTNYLSVLVYIALIGACWFQLDHTERGISDINGMFFFVVTEGNFNVKLNGVLAFTRYKSVIQNERQESMYRLSAYFFSKLASEVFVDNIERLILYSVIYWLVGLTTNAWLFFASLGIYMLGNLVAHAIGIILGIVFKQLDVALTVSLALMVCNMAVGDMLVRQLPYYLRWLKYAAFMKYIIGALLKLEFIYGEPLRCSGVNETRFSECFSNTTNGFIPGDKVCEYLQQTLPLWVDVLVLLVLLLTLYCLTYVALRFIDKPRKINS